MAVATKKKKKLLTQIKLQIEAAKANPAPPIGPALGQHGVNIMQFCKEYNEKTKDKVGQIIPVVINVYEDRSFTFITKTPPVSDLIKKKIKIEKGSAIPNREKVGKITIKEIEEIAKVKMPDLNALDIEAAKKIVMGTARSMGVTVEG